MRFKPASLLSAAVAVALLASCSGSESGSGATSGSEGTAASNTGSVRNENGWELVSTESAMDGNALVAQKEFKLSQAIVEVFVECKASKFSVRAQTFSPDGNAMRILQDLDLFNQFIPTGRAKVGQRAPSSLANFFGTTNYDNVIELTDTKLPLGLYRLVPEGADGVNWVRILKDNLPLIVEVNGQSATVEFIVEASAPVLRVIDECGGNRPPYDGAAEGSSLPAAQAGPDAPMEQSVSVSQSPSAATSAGGSFVPVEVMEGPDPVYPWSLQGSGIAGTVLVEVEVDETGRGTAVRVKRSSGNTDLDEAAVVGVERWSFNPAQQNGGPVRSSSEYEITFDAE